MSAFAVLSFHAGAGTASKLLTASDCISSAKEISDLVSLSLFESPVGSGLLLDDESDGESMSGAWLDDEPDEESTPPDPDPDNGDPNASFIGSHVSRSASCPVALNAFANSSAATFRSHDWSSTDLGGDESQDVELLCERQLGIGDSLLAPVVISACHAVSRAMESLTRSGPSVHAAMSLPTAAP